jgi:D-alanyl-D-alanine carboxypeptidase/D-alanyl-D-alanine-endopeptidase (penicillin-binding protein 4)
MKRASVSIAVVAALALCASATAEAKGRHGKARKARSTLRHKKRSVKPRTIKRTSKKTAPTARERLVEEIKQVWSGRHLRAGTTAVLVVDAESGEKLFEEHADDKLNPASNVKLISTATVLDAIGPDWRYTTRLLGATPDQNGLSTGDLYLYGSYDPTLGVDHLAALARSVAESGVKKIVGDVLIGEDVLRDTLGTPHVKVTVRSSRTAGAAPEVEISPKLDFIRIENTAKTTKRRRRTAPKISSSIVKNADGSEQLLIKVSGKIRAGRKAKVRRQVHRRSTFTAHVVRAALAEAGVEVVGGVKIVAFDDYMGATLEGGFFPVELARHESKPMGQLVAQVNKRSLNYLSDRLVMTAGAVRFGGTPTMEVGIRAMKDWLLRAGINPDQVVVNTGSGLSYKTQLSARQIVKVLRAASGYVEEQNDPRLTEIYQASLAVGGIDGTLRRRFRRSKLKGKVIGKTGTLTSCIALSGFVSDNEGNRLCFSIVTNGNRHHLRRNVRKENEAMVGAMHDYLEDRPALQHSAATPADPPATATAVPAADVEADEADDSDEDSAGDEVADDGDSADDSDSSEADVIDSSNAEAP